MYWENASAVAGSCGAKRCCDTRGPAAGAGRRSPNLEIIGECGTGGVRGSFLPAEAIRLPSPADEQRLQFRRTRHALAVVLCSDTLFVRLKTHHHSTLHMNSKDRSEPYANGHSNDSWSSDSGVVGTRDRDVGRTMTERGAQRLLRARSLSLPPPPAPSRPLRRCNLALQLVS